MKEEHPSGNPRPREDEPLISSILKAALSLQGIECESAVFLSWRVIGGRPLAHPIITLGDLFREFGDGSYQLAITGATISGIEKQPFAVPEINVQLDYEAGQWSEPTIFTDQEEFGPEHENPQALHARLDKIKQNLPRVLSLIVLFSKAAQSVREAFTSS